MAETKILTADDLRQRLRAMTRASYDLQKLRIQTGLRLCANFRSKLGQVAGDTEEDLEDKAQEVIKTLRASFVKLTDGIARNRTLPEREGFKGDEIISDYTELMLVSQYLELDRVEKRQFGQLEAALQDFPIYRQFLSGVTGVGPAMAAVILSEFDIHRARHVSSLWAYAGLDVVTKWKLKDVRWEVMNPARGRPDIEAALEREYLLRDAAGGNGPVTVGEETHSVAYTTEVDRSYFDGIENATGKLGVLRISKDGWTFAMDYAEISLGGRSRKRAHLVKRTYTDKDGKEQERDSITFNPFLKTKLMGVLAGSFLRTGSEYREAYDGYKHRIQSDPAKKEWSKGRINEASKRYMVKQFLADLYDRWRTLEGLPVTPRYSEAKLGLPKHGEAGTVPGERLAAAE